MSTTHLADEPPFAMVATDASRVRRFEHDRCGNRRPALAGDGSLDSEGPKRSSCAEVTRHLTKIVGTLGPASQSVERIGALIAAGLDVARINGSHGDHEAHGRTIAAVREAAAQAGRAVGILFDLQGPKIRIGKYDGPPREVAKGDEIVFAVGREADLGAGELPSDYALLDKDVAVGAPLLIDDILNRTETAMTQEHSFLAMELAIKAENAADRIGNLRGRLI